jgi:hypothetical protein
VPVADRLQERARQWWEMNVYIYLQRIFRTLTLHRRPRTGVSHYFGASAKLLIEESQHQGKILVVSDAGHGPKTEAVTTSRCELLLRTDPFAIPLELCPCGGISNGAISMARMTIDAPANLFNLHLADAIRTWLAAGDQLVVALDYS